ncbi:MAG: hypothetical protein H6999_00455 [Hahellaceae bacterium]|nr:hypothetical protein [Hahellaceae bacterium]MCP5168221.1 hypothetical protein [Hahellaceae bacterium]
MLHSKGLLRLVFACGALVSETTLAELRPLDDNTLSEMTGQALMSIGETKGLNAGESFTRMTLSGIETDLYMSIGALSVAKRALPGTTTAADIDATNFALGTQGGASFRAYSPYFEVAKVDGDVVGIRIGYMDAQGEMTGSYSSLTGNIGLKIDMDGTGTDIRDAQLLNETGTATNYRATNIGIDDGSGTCGSSCAPLSNLNTISVGKDDGTGGVQSTKDFFFAMQSQTVNWLSNESPKQAITAESELYLNIPTSMTVNLSDLNTGTLSAAAQTPYVEAGTNLF